MMCGGCAARVRAILAADPRVETAAVNLLAESAAVRLRAPAPPGAGEELAARLTECGFPATARRGGAATGAGESARKWREMAARKEELLARSRGRVAFAWTLVALCCGSHASHILHSLGIHIGHGELELQRDMCLFGSAPGNDAWARQLPQAVDFQRLGLDRPAWAGLPRRDPDPNRP